MNLHFLHIHYFLLLNILLPWHLEEISQLIFLMKWKWQNIIISHFPGKLKS